MEINSREAHSPLECIGSDPQAEHNQEEGPGACCTSALKTGRPVRTLR